MKEEIKDNIKKIKQSFRLLMNGVASRSMREKGVEYHINWGIQLPALKNMAKEYGKDYELAVELWKEDIRECKILATMIMPADKMTPELAFLWMEQTKSQEIAEIAAFNLYQYLDYAPMLAFQWMASDNPICQVSAYQILSRLFVNKREPDERGINEYIDQVMIALQNDNVGVKHAAYNSLLHFMELSETHEMLATNAIKSCGLDII